MLKRGVLISVSQRNRQMCLMVALSVLVMAGCAATPYQPMRRGGGYDDFRINESFFEVTFKWKEPRPQV